MWQLRLFEATSYADVLVCVGNELTLCHYLLLDPPTEIANYRATFRSALCSRSLLLGLVYGNAINHG